MINLKDQAEIKEKQSIASTDLAQILTHDDTHLNSKITKSTKALNDCNDKHIIASDVLLASARKLTEHINNITENSKKNCAKVKNVVNELKDQMVKVDNIVGGNIELKVVQLERIAAAMITIKNLSQDKGVMNVLASMTGEK